MKKVLIGKVIKKLRLEKKLTQAELGSFLGFSARTISDWEYGNTEPDLTTVKNIVHFFNINYEDLFEND